MIPSFVIGMVAKHKALLLHEADKINGFMKLLMKPRNTHEKWTNEEKRMLRSHIWHLSYYIPALVIFALPFGSLLFPFLAEMLDRRKKGRTAVAAPRQRESEEPQRLAQES